MTRRRRLSVRAKQGTTLEGEAMDVEEALSEVFAAAKFPRRDPPEETTTELVGEAARKAIEERKGLRVGMARVADAGAGDGLPLDLGKVREIQRAMGEVRVRLPLRIQRQPRVGFVDQDSPRLFRVRRASPLLGQTARHQRIVPLSTGTAAQAQGRPGEGTHGTVEGTADRVTFDSRNRWRRSCPAAWLPCRWSPASSTRKC